LFGILVLLWGTVTLVTKLLAIALDISWWGIFAIIVGAWFLANAVRKKDTTKH
jgi:uncharacterized membrane protein HdeD (DUF308 family)